MYCISLPIYRQQIEIFEVMFSTKPCTKNFHSFLGKDYSLLDLCNLSLLTLFHLSDVV